VYRRSRELPAHSYVTYIANGAREAACLIRVPTEVIKTRMQTSSYGNLAHGSFAAARLVWANDGLRGFYRGYGMTILREVDINSLLRNT
jgi:solute carrier family 25 S-adenosylmethionine transporter 26